MRTLNATKDVLGLGVYIGVKSCQVSTPGICIYIYSHHCCLAIIYIYPKVCAHMYIAPLTNTENANMCM